ncbi:MAG: A/G-specific adenine glycosylase [Candidatus Thalassarchaeaceae archaeon]|jgi:A/G-specific adenine glycosylase|nr:A/G-specific adenine glycosylase [Candidatus Thalassarchaeaceae archaeon]
MEAAQAALLSWYETNARPLPWRISKVSAWEILLAEIILQQTRMETGLEYWERIRKEYPNPQLMAAKPQERLLQLWQGCGYYARARNLYKLACQLGSKPLPQTRDDLLELPGIGTYTAAAVSSIAFGESVACVDGNVRRVISRLRAKHLTNKEVQINADQLLYTDRPGEWNQAIMELGSTICTPRKPKCVKCPLQPHCLATQTPTPEEWPASRKVKQKKVQATVLIIAGNGGLVLNEREGKILGGLWGLPYQEGENAQINLLNSLNIEDENITEIGQITHDFSHKKIQITVLLTSSKNHKLTNPRDVPLATLDRKVIALYESEAS